MEGYHTTKKAKNPQTNKYYNTCEIDDESCDKYNNGTCKTCAIGYVREKDSNKQYVCSKGLIDNCAKFQNKEYCKKCMPGFHETVKVKNSFNQWTNDCVVNDPTCKK